MKKSYLTVVGEFHGISTKTKKGDKGEYLASYVNLICRDDDDALLVIRVRTYKPELFEKTEQRAPVTLPVRVGSFKDYIFYTHVI